jgi:hypothetical protein
MRDLKKEVERLKEQLGREKEGQVDLEKQLLKANKKRTTLIGLREDKEKKGLGTYTRT